MASKKSPPKKEPDKTPRKQLVVVSSNGVRNRFLRGMVTHDLMQRGLDFDDAYAAAKALRDELADRDTVTTDEIRKLIVTQLEKTLGPELPPNLRASIRPAPAFYVERDGHAQPFSRGLLARSIQAAGVDQDAAYDIVNRLQRELMDGNTTTLSAAELARRVGDALERFESKGTAHRYRTVRQIQRLPRPLVIYIGGASGTGKSTLALELAPLLKIYRLNSTDTIRQVMRMVFSPQVLPSLYASSFEIAGSARPRAASDTETEARLLATFEEQSRRVTVGVRAVVERAISENMSILVEGVHLYPPLVPFADLEGAAYQLAVVLGTQDKEVHRTRFFGRGRYGGRRGERYLGNFAAIRVVHDYLLGQAETYDVPLVDTSEGEPQLERSVHLITGLLRKRLPSLSDASWAIAAPPTLLVVVDGLADRPVRALGGRTPLEAARTPTLDRLAREGRSGLADPVAPGVVADTAAGVLALFGQSPRAMSRGPVEALGAGFRLTPGDVALRGNFATMDSEGRIVDRRAGRIRRESDELAKSLDRLPLPGIESDEAEVRARAATEHRLAIVIRGDGLSSAIHGSDPGERGVPGPPLTPAPADPGNEAAVHTARVLALFEQEARRVLRKHPLNKARRAGGVPVANAVLSRGPGHVHRLLPLEESGLPLRLTCVSGDRTVLGLAAWVGADTVTSPEMTANLDTSLDAKFDFVADALKRSDLVVLHVKGADIAAHDRRPDLKASFLEKLDGHLAKLVDGHGGAIRIAVAADHATLSESGQHAADPLPVLLWGAGIDPDGVERFDEKSAASGELQRFPLQMLLSRLFNLT